MNTQEKQAIKEVLFDYNAETIEFAGDIADRILRKLDELRKPSEPETNVCEAGEGLGSEIDAALMQPDNELLEAAKDALRTFYGIGCNEEAEIVQVLTKAILNYEKQSK